MFHAPSSPASAMAPLPTPHGRYAAAVWDVRHVLGHRTQGPGFWAEVLGARSLGLVRAVQVAKTMKARFTERTS